MLLDFNDGHQTCWLGFILGVAVRNRQWLVYQ
jgi:hypothetical protein